MSSWLRSLNMASKNVSLVLGPILGLTARLWLAQIFLLAAALQFAAPGEAPPSNLYACFEGWLASESPAKMSLVWLSMLFAALLAGGLATRLAAGVLAGIALASFLFEVGQEQNLLWALMLGFIALFGAGPLSLDSLLRRGEPNNATGRFLKCIQPAFLLFMRMWLVAVILVGVWGPSGIGDTLALLAPRSMVFGYYEHFIHIGLAGLAILFLAPGFLVRPAAGIAAPILAITALNTGGAETMYLAVLVGFMASYGPGAWALEHWFKLDRWPSADLKNEDEVPHIVVVGAGFGGLAAVSRLAREKCRITLIDRRNHHLFQPLLYQVASAALNPSDIALPIRALFRRQKNVQVLLGDVIATDREKREVLLANQRISYDHLIVATGSRPSYHGMEQWADLAPGLKQIEDATLIRSRLLSAFEHAEDALDTAEQKNWMTFVIIGAGPTGIEMAGAMAELAHHGLTGEFRNIDPTHARIIVLDRGKRCLSSFPQSCSKRVERMLVGLGVEVRHDAALASMDTAGVTLEDGTRIAARTILWTAGVQASNAHQWLGVKPGPGGRIPVTKRLRLADDPRVFVVGDTAAIVSPDGSMVPGLAPAAKQAGLYAARVIIAKMNDKTVPAPFSYRHQGSLATIGRSSAIADFGWIRLTGAPAWWLWGMVHVGFLTGVRNKIAVAFQWIWAYLTYDRSTRLITGPGAKINSDLPAP
ncbi:MAG: hypothetical protein COA47_08090 [Robiginitomaculum sp.]|nr:MAG: hypothetical protein COA47_08090 [Robiginitomaculum sp.]